MTKDSATTMSGKDRKQYHIGCKPGDLAEYIMLVGDPGRAAKVAAHFEKIRFQNQHREYVTVTGKYKGMDLTVMATGMGQDNTEIAMVEICQITRNPTFLRCGTTGALQPAARLTDLLVSRGAVRLENLTSFYVLDGYPAVADSDVLIAIGRACKKLRIPFHVGITASAVGFFGPQGRELPGFPIRYPNLQADLARMNVMNLEMETSALFILASLRGLRAGAVCTVVASRPRNEKADPEEILRGEKKCIEVSLKTFEYLRKMDADKKKRKLPLWLPA
ncbi:MAG: nucleoside phosphorylase [Pseudomonadota bacterium]